jgi:hypothetical protein
MVSNVQRNRPYELVSTSKRSKIGNPRSCLGLYYSVDCETWFLAGLVADSGDRVHAFHYPHFIFDGQDLLVIARSHVESPLNEDTVNKDSNTADGHDSNAATFHQVRSFRQLANRSFIHYQKSKSKIH